MPAAGRDGAVWRRTVRPLRFLLALPVLLALAGCDAGQEAAVPFTPTSDQGGGEAVVQGWLARHRPRPVRPGADRAGAGAGGFLAGAPRGTVLRARVARVAGQPDRHRA